MIIGNTQKITEARTTLAAAIEQDAAIHGANCRLRYSTIPALEDALRTAEIGAIADRIYQTQGAHHG
ncbi:hypothetical protein GBK02_09970 [Dechloromonas sp. TW-R-39-2]|uniref:hypothetical protein n=1 Tax=Dechloromonas sp. TW-R-39-2 TaxID=2654218 RepID=UPI00193DCE83|nr:hypothetical protein [Dechloromonas sp. TW-R-39-2]QRM19704.1 hypothetical protein GBK02_09970 [Dechloromonas sp. TW-R-39-2]